MSKSILFSGILFILSLLVVSCSTSYAQKKAKIRVGKDFSLSIEKTSCRGTCPGYVAKIDAKGYLVYEGSRNVKNIGKFTKTLSSTQLKQLVAEFNKAQFFTLQDKYDSDGIADLPVCTISYTNRGKSKTVIGRYMAPEAFDTLALAIEKIMGTEGFTKAN